MRIVAGKHRGRILQAPKGRDTRPTSDRTRGAVFNILEHGIDGLELRSATVLDVFAGTGALGLEALSRGADQVTFIETGREALKEQTNTTLLKADATRPKPCSTPCSLIFLDPPYGKGLIPKSLKALAAQNWIAPGAICVVEEGVDAEIEVPEGFEEIDRRVYGAAQILFLREIRLTK